MSDLTPTNEETLARIIQNLKEGETLVLIPSRPDDQSPRLNMLECYVLPKGYHSSLFYSVHGFEGPDGPGLSPFWRASFMAMELHPEVWKANPTKAQRWR